MAGAGPLPTRSPRSGLRSPRAPARPSALTESSARCPRAGGGPARTGKRARRRDGHRTRAGPLQPLTSKPSEPQNRPARILPHSHFRKLSRKPGGLTALWSACKGTKYPASRLSAAPRGWLSCCWGLWTEECHMFMSPKLLPGQPPASADKGKGWVVDLRRALTMPNGFLFIPPRYPVLSC